MLDGIHHVSINVSDVDAAVEFYVGVLGMTLLPRPDLGFPGAWLGNGGQEVHLLGLANSPAPKEQHFAFRVPSLAAVVESLQSKGIECSKPQEMKDICLQAFCRDPSGNLVEFNERLG